MNPFETCWSRSKHVGLDLITSTKHVTRNMLVLVQSLDPLALNLFVFVDKECVVKYSSKLKC